MPKVRKIFTRTVYGYVKPVNDDFLRKDRKKRGVSKSMYLDALIESQRTGKPFEPKRPLTVAQKRAQASEARQE